MVRVLASHQWPGSIPARRHMLVELATRVFLRVYSFAASTKTNTPTSTLARRKDPHENKLRMMSLPL